MFTFSGITVSEAVSADTAAKASVSICKVDDLREVS